MGMQSTVRVVNLHLILCKPADKQKCRGSLSIATGEPYSLLLSMNFLFRTSNMSETVILSLVVFEWIVNATVAELLCYQNTS